ncbi:hypothetical protein LGH70_04435 [Hymenobacter sp. BT635]|uniref:DUF2975 domain-containing protein n=1 Tax=Hymenobacter nitidus TaxID=2880929 RepID=A0ABS8A9B3_9BACT|nr:hypothetical protein [Hymenobacter nitidus]MCB2376814.1 hypothetical protein [Hymenobacter nitidus]
MKHPETIRNKVKLGGILNALLVSWVTMVFGTGFLIFVFAPIKLVKYNSNFIANALRSTWEIGDAMGPAVKISYILLLGLLLLAFKGVVNKTRTFSYLLPIVFAVLSATLVLAFLPAEFSRGYGIGLTGVRFDIGVLPIYFMGAILSGLAFGIVFNGLAEKQKAV